MTLKHWLITGALAVAAIPAGADLYRWVDASGTVHYSDTPQPGAEKIELKPTNVIRGRRSTSRPASGSSNSSGGESSPDAESGEAGLILPYSSASIVSPTEGETLWNLGGSLVVNVRTEPGLQTGHGIVIIYDGRPVNAEAVASTSVTINNVYRGEHSVRASIKDEEGNTVFDGESVTFFVQQSTAN